MTPLIYYARMVSMDTDGFIIERCDTTTITPDGKMTVVYAATKTDGNTKVEPDLAAAQEYLKGGV